MSTQTSHEPTSQPWSSTAKRIGPLRCHLCERDCRREPTCVSWRATTTSRSADRVSSPPRCTSSWDAWTVNSASELLGGVGRGEDTRYPAERRTAVLESS